MIILSSRTNPYIIKISFTHKAIFYHIWILLITEDKENPQHYEAI